MTATERRPVVASQVEPRIVERRRTVLESQRRRRRRRWIAVGVLVAVLAGVVAVLASPLTDVDSVEVRGVTSLDVDELRDRSGIAAGDQMVTVDLAAARRSLRAVPTVASVSVQRKWPDTVQITVVEEEPLVRVSTGDGDAVVSRTGRVLPADVAVPEVLPVLEVPPTELEVGGRVPDDVRSALVVFLRLPESLTTTLAAATLDDAGLVFRLPDDASIRFGPVEDVPAKLVAVQSFVEQVTMQCLDVLDVRQPELPTASRIDGCAVPPPTDVGGTTAPSDGQDGAGDGEDAAQ